MIVTLSTGGITAAFRGLMLRYDWRVIQQAHFFSEKARAAKDFLFLFGCFSFAQHLITCSAPDKIKHFMVTVTNGKSQITRIVHWEQASTSSLENLPNFHQSTH